MKCINAQIRNNKIVSPSPRRAWIEIVIGRMFKAGMQSPSPRRAWIEIVIGRMFKAGMQVALPTEGVD